MRKQDGFTLIELIMTIVIVGIISFIAAQMFLFGFDGYQVVAEREGNLEDGRFALHMLERDLRGWASRDGLVPDASRLEFKDLNDQTIIYEFIGDKLYRNTYLVSENLEQFEFSYLRSDGQKIASPADSIAFIWSVSVKVGVRKGTNVITLQTQVHPRNLGNAN